MCYCKTTRDEIRKHLKTGEIPVDSLTNACCWNTISLVHREHSDEIDENIWSKIVDKRSILLLNLNPFSSDS